MMIDGKIRPLYQLVRLFAKRRAPIAPPLRDAGSRPALTLEAHQRIWYDYYASRFKGTGDTSS
eukprot:2449708-Prorocentrum_lima.AAC.1